MSEPYYSDEFVTLYHGDCLEVLPGLQDLGLIVTSPPYNLGTSLDDTPNEAMHNRSRPGYGERDQRFSDGYDDHDDAMPLAEYRSWQRKVLSACWRSLRPDGAIFYNHKPRVQRGKCALPTDYVPDEVLLRQVIIWDRITKGMAYVPAAYNTGYEMILLLAKPDFTLRSRSASAASDIWRFPPSTADVDHPCPFPIGIPETAIATSQVNGPVLDPFCGSGTTLAAAKAAGIRSIGIDRSERYCEVAAARCGSWRHSVTDDGTLWSVS